jgi:hypothetical protein
VHPARNRVEILAEPAPYRPRPNLRQRRRHHPTRAFCAPSQMLHQDLTSSLNLSVLKRSPLHTCRAFQP